MWPFRKRPRYINGYRVREAGARCPLCHAREDAWCYRYCKAIDVMDYR